MLRILRQTCVDSIICSLVIWLPRTVYVGVHDGVVLVVLLRRYIGMTFPVMCKLLFTPSLILLSRSVSFCNYTRDGPTCLS